MLSATRLMATDPLSQAMSLLDRWHLSVSSTGALWIRCRRLDITFGDLDLLMSRVGESLSRFELRFVVLDITGSTITRQHRPLVMRLIQELARRMAAVCRPLPRTIDPEFMNTDTAGVETMTDTAPISHALNHCDGEVRPTCFLFRRVDRELPSAVQN